MAMAPTMRRIGGRQGAGRVFGLGDYPPNALGQAALDMYNSLPPGSGVNPIGRDPAYPWPHVPAQDNVVDTEWGGNRYVDWYWAHPVKDASGLMEWTGLDSANWYGGLTPVQALVAQILQNNGDTSFSADIHPPNAIQAAKPIGNSATTGVTEAPVEYIPTTWHPTGDYQTPPIDLAQHPNQPPPDPSSGTGPGATTPTAPPVSQPIVTDGGGSIPKNLPPLIYDPTVSAPYTTVTPVSTNGAATGTALQNANYDSSMNPVMSPGAVSMAQGASASAPVSGGMSSTWWIVGGLAAAVLLGGRKRRT